MSKSDSPNFSLDILAVAPHPDDAELSVGGTLIKLAALGYSTGILDLTRGEMSSAGDLPTREKETSAASQLLGLKFRENLALPDCWIDPYSGTDLSNKNSAAQIVKVVAALRRLRPEILLIPYCEDRHPDHSATSNLLARAIFLAGVAKFPGGHDEAKFVPRQVLYYQMRYQFSPSFIVDISGHSEKKISAISCYKSQIFRSGDVQTLLNSPLTLATVETVDRYYGAMLGVSHGEPFKMVNTFGVGDPIEHFRRNPYTEPLIFPGLK